jgi:hypothetical protein
VTIEDPYGVGKITSEMKQAAISYLKLMMTTMMIFRIIT